MPLISDNTWSYSSSTEFTAFDSTISYWKKKNDVNKIYNKRLNHMMFTYGFAYSIVIFVVDSRSVPTINWNLHGTVQN